MIPIDLPTIWAFIIAFAVFVYVVMDGFDLGLGILFPLFPKKADRDVIMNSVAPVWDGNETWLVLGGGRDAGGTGRDVLARTLFARMRWRRHQA